MTTQTQTASANDAGTSTESSQVSVTAAALADSEDFALPACFLRPGDAGFEECEACQ